MEPSKFTASLFAWMDMVPDQDVFKIDLISSYNKLGYETLDQILFIMERTKIDVNYDKNDRPLVSVRNAKKLMELQDPNLAYLQRCRVVVKNPPELRKLMSKKSVEYLMDYRMSIPLSKKMLMPTKTTMETEKE